MNKEGTDVYFHVVEPKSGKVLPYQDPLVRRYVYLDTNINMSEKQ